MVQRVLESYLQSLRSKEVEHLLVGKDGRIAARFFNARLSSVFQAMRSGPDSKAFAYQAMVRSFSVNDTGLNILTLLEHATTDDESVALDRLCRLLHVLNFFRQYPESHIDLHLNVHSRLLTAVRGNHGAAFQRVLASLDIPQTRIVLQLPATTPSQEWAIAHVAKNYRTNGFRFAVHARHLQQAFELLESVNPDVLTLNADDLLSAQTVGLVERLMLKAQQQACCLIVRQLDQMNSWHVLQDLAKRLPTLTSLGIQGNAIDIARAILPDSALQTAKRGLVVRAGYGRTQQCCS